MPPFLAPEGEKLVAKKFEGPSRVRGRAYSVRVATRAAKRKGHVSCREAPPHARGPGTFLLDGV